MNYLYKDVYTTLYFAMNDLNALNRMLTVKIRVKDRLVYIGSNEQYCTERNDVSLRSITQRDTIGSVHKLIFNNQSAAQRDRTML